MGKDLENFRTDPARQRSGPCLGGRGQRTRNLILQTAVRLFARQDQEQVTLRQITGQAGINIAMVKFYFGGKEGLYLETLAYACRMGLLLLRDLPQPPRPSDPDARGQAILALAASFRMLVRAGLQAKVPAGGGKVPELRQDALTLLGRTLGTPRADARAAVQEVVDAMRAHLNGCLRVLCPDLDPESQFRMATSVLGHCLLFFLRPELVDAARGESYQGSDLEGLIGHFLQFSLAGLETPGCWRPGAPG
jgi:AcrR family transcriptional regulator